MKKQRKKKTKKPSKAIGVCAKSRSGALLLSTCIPLEGLEHVKDDKCPRLNYGTYEYALRKAWSRLEKIKDVDGYTLHNQGGWRMVRVIITEDLRSNPIHKLEV